MLNLQKRLIIGILMDDTHSWGTEKNNLNVV